MTLTGVLACIPAIIGLVLIVILIHDTRHYGKGDHR